MRTATPFLLLGIGLAIVACGGKPKPADDPSNEASKTTNDGTENTKWDSSSSTASSSSSSSSSSSTAGAAGSGTGGRGVSSVNEGTSRRQDQYDKDATEVVIKRAARQVQANCGAAKDDSGKATGPWGKFSIQISLGHNGHSKGINVPPPYQGKAVGNCIEKAFTNLTYPPWGGQDTDVSWEVELVQPAAEPATKK